MARQIAADQSLDGVPEVSLVVCANAKDIDVVDSPYFAGLFHSAGYANRRSPATLMRLTVAVPEVSLEQIFGRPVVEKKAESALTFSDPGISLDIAPPATTSGPRATAIRALYFGGQGQASGRDRAFRSSCVRDGTAPGHFEAPGKTGKRS